MDFWVLFLADASSSGGHIGALDWGGGAMLHVKFEKWHYPLAINLQGPRSSLTCSHATCQFLEVTHVVSLILILISIGSMSHVEFRKCHCLLAINLQGPRSPLTSYMSPCHMSTLRNNICRVTYSYSHIARLHVACRVLRKRPC